MIKIDNKYFGAELMVDALLAARSHNVAGLVHSGYRISFHQFQLETFIELYQGFESCQASCLRGGHLIVIYRSIKVISDRFLG